MSDLAQGATIQIKLTGTKDFHLRVKVVNLLIKLIKFISPFKVDVNVA